MTAPGHPNAAATMLPGLVVIGHGARHRPDGGAPLLDLAARLRQGGGFSEVVPLFLRQEPRLGPLDRLTRAPRVAVVPVLTGGGAFAESRLAALAGLDGPRSLRDGRRFDLTDPVGHHPAFAALAGNLGAEAARTAGIDPATATLVLVAHGSTRPQGAGSSARHIARTITTSGRFKRVIALFLEQPPWAHDWATQAGPGPVVVVPLLLSEGGHARRDLPALFATGGRAVVAPAPSGAAALDDIVRDLALRALERDET